jgi:hypothetical protein
MMLNNCALAKSLGPEDSSRKDAVCFAPAKQKNMGLCDEKLS